ncbi:MAG TPA: ABC transporter permease, partial [Tenuifilaceae bacterium]|nr:ABC transporter permease [Tenuifilaceae bacterium]
MIKYNLLVALRNMSRNKIFSTINILGLAGSMAVFVLITSYVRLIAGTDKFHEHHPNIFRIERPKIHNMAAPIGPFLKQNYPEVEEYIRTYEIQGNGGLVKHNDKFIRLNSTWLADSSFFNVFTFPLIAGNPSSVLSSPDGIVLSEESAKRIFGDINPIGQSILWGNKHNLRVTGIMENMPANSSIQADAVIPIDFYKTMRNDSKALDNFYQWNYNTFLLLKTGVNVAEFEKKLQDELFEFLKKNIQIPESEKIEFILTNFPDIYFNTYNNNDDLTHGSRSNITI